MMLMFSPHQARGSSPVVSGHGSRISSGMAGGQEISRRFYSAVETGWERDFLDGK